MKTATGKFRWWLALGAAGLLVPIFTVRIVPQGALKIVGLSTARLTNKPGLRSTADVHLLHSEKYRALIGIERGKIAQELRASFRRDQVRMELVIQQRRYGRDYWQTEASEKQLRELDRIQSMQLRGLAREMNELLDGLCGDKSDEIITLAPIFDASHPGPNIGFLSPESRAKVEELIAEQSLHGLPDAAELLTKMETVLSGKELVQYRQWNSPDHGLLRNQLVGFNATEGEFNAIAQWPGFVNQGNSSTDDDQVMLELADRIGVQRLADLIRLRDPEIQTAVHDLHRLGLPLDQAEALAALRGQGVSEIEQTWTDPTVPSAMKELRVRQLLGDYRARIAATFQIAANSTDQNELLP